MKKAVISVLVGTAVLAFVACGKNAATENSSDSGVSTVSASSQVENGQKATRVNHIKEQSLIQKQPSKSEGCFCIYARKAHNIRLSGLFLFSGDLVD